MRNLNSNVVDLLSAQQRLRPAGTSTSTSTWYGTEADVVDLTASRLRTPGSPPSLIGQIWDAIEEDRVVVHYQPQFDLATGQIVSMEALARIAQAPGKPLLYPDSFIADAEDNGLIVGLGRAVARRACRDFASWRKAGASIERIAINLSASQLNLDETFTDFMSTTLATTGLHYSDVEFELTERQLLESGSIGMDILHDLSRSGSRLALDDFGTGFSSLSYLTSLDVHTIKLDRGMVQWLPDHHTTSRIVEHVLTLADELNLQVVAEGLKSKEQQHFLAEAGCHLGQGFFLSPPLPQDQVMALLARH